MPDYRRHRLPGATYFFTVNLFDRNSSLLVDHIDVLRHAVARVRTLMPFHIDAWVVLPEQMHCLWTLPQDDRNFLKRWEVIKMIFSRRITSGEPLSASRQICSERGIWQRRYGERTIRDKNDYAAHMDYIHFNPVGHGYVTHPADWKFFLIPPRRTPGTISTNMDRINSTNRNLGRAQMTSLKQVRNRVQCQRHCTLTAHLVDSVGCSASGIAPYLLSFSKGG